MADDIAAVIDHVGKCYHVYNKPIDRLKQSLLLGKTKLYHEFWALRDISFTIPRGQTVGIVGSNGSGKSTLLQLLCGVLQPTTGNLCVNGRIGALLELGAGFNPEETGRENVLINAAIRGVPQADLPALYERIAAFADIGDFIDRPVKVYSSGMAVRLGFAMQISIPCEVLIIDEALAVGDELFQRRCYAALEKFRDDGGTVLFVSHAAAMVKQLCSTALFLDRGELIQLGTAKPVVENYQKFLYMREPQRTQFRSALKGKIRSHNLAQIANAAATQPIDDIPSSVSHSELNSVNQGVDRSPPPADFDRGLRTQTIVNYQSEGAEIQNYRIESLDGKPVNVLNPRERYRFCYEVRFSHDAENVIFGWLIKTTSGVELGGGAHDSSDGFIRHIDAGSIYNIAFEFNAILFPGVYYINCGVMGTVGDHDGYLHRVVDSVAFRVRSVYSKVIAGFVDFDYYTNIEIVSTDELAHAAPVS